MVKTITESERESLALKKIARREKITDVREIPEELYLLLTSTILTQFNCEEWGGLNYLTCRKLAAWSDSEITNVTRIGIQELGHARILEKGPLKALGINPWEQIAFSVQAQTQILRIFTFPQRFTTWAHFLMFNHLQDRSAAIQLARFKEGPFLSWNEAIGKIEVEEVAHIEHGEKGIRELAESERGRLELRRAFNDWYPLALEVFGAPDNKSKSLPLYRKYNLKDSNDGPRNQFKTEVKPLLVECGFDQSLFA